MCYLNTLKFVDKQLNARLIDLFKSKGQEHFCPFNAPYDEVLYFNKDKELVENLISEVRNESHSQWQFLTFPKEWEQTYRDYIAKHKIYLIEELHNDKLIFVIPSYHRPHAWKLKPPL